MAGLDAKTPLPTEIKLHQTSRVLELAFNDGASFRLPYEFLRVYSPSAEVRGHGPGQETLQAGKREVTIAEVEDLVPVGSLAADAIHTPGIFVQRIIHGTNYDKRIEKRTVRESA